MTVSLPRAAALAFAAILLFAAATDYVPAFRDAEGRVFGLFRLDVYKDALHLASGLWALAAALWSRSAAVTFLRAFGAIYLLDGVVGVLTGSSFLDLSLFLKGFQDSPLLSNGPHLCLGLAGVVLGWWPWRGAATVAVVGALLAPAISLQRERSTGESVATGVQLWRDGQHAIVVLDGRADAVRTLEALRRAGVRRLDVVVARSGATGVGDVIRALDDRYGMNIEAIADPLVAASVIEPADLDMDSLADIDFDRVLWAAMGLNRGATPDPKASLVSLLTETSSQTSSRPSDSESPSGDTEDGSPVAP